MSQELFCRSMNSTHSLTKKLWQILRFFGLWPSKSRPLRGHGHMTIWHWIGLASRIVFSKYEVNPFIKKKIMTNVKVSGFWPSRSRSFRNQSHMTIWLCKGLVPRIVVLSLIKVNPLTNKKVMANAIVFWQFDLEGQGH